MAAASAAGRDFRVWRSKEFLRRHGPENAMVSNRYIVGGGALVRRRVVADTAQARFKVRMSQWLRVKAHDD